VADELDNLEELVEAAGLREELKGAAEEELVEPDFVDEIDRTEDKVDDSEVP
jgi:hypothetical protein